MGQARWVIQQLKQKAKDSGIARRVSANANARCSQKKRRTQAAKTAPLPEAKHENPALGAAVSELVLRLRARAASALAGKALFSSSINSMMS